MVLDNADKSAKFLTVLYVPGIERFDPAPGPTPAR